MPTASVEVNTEETILPAPLPLPAGDDGSLLQQANGDVVANGEIANGDIVSGEMVGQASGEYDTKEGGSSLEDQAKYDAPPVLTALTETYKDGKHTYMCVEYSRAMTADNEPAPEVPPTRAVCKGVLWCKWQGSPVSPPVWRGDNQNGLAQ